MALKKSEQLLYMPTQMNLTNIMSSNRGQTQMSTYHMFLYIKSENRQYYFMVIDVRVVAAFEGMQGYHSEKKGYREASWGVGSILYLDPDGSYMGIYISKSLSACTLKIGVLFTVFYLVKEHEPKHYLETNILSKFSQAVLILQHCGHRRIPQNISFFLIDRFILGNSLRLTEKLIRKCTGTPPQCLSTVSPMHILCQCHT